MTGKLIAVGLALAVTLAAPFLLRPEGATSAKDAQAVVTVVTPHNESIRSEFARAFAKHMRDTRDLVVHVDWRTPGAGTADLERYLQSEFRANFENYWRKVLGRDWNEAEIGRQFDNRKLPLPDNPADDELKHEARRAFLTSDVSCGVDVFFGGGDYPFKRFAAMGYLVDAGVRERHPEWFDESVIPASFSGEIYYDPELRWVGASLSAFGICYNPLVLERLKIETPPSSWDDLGEPAYYRNIALANPTKSGSVTKALEMLVQQKMRDALERTGDENAALENGWADGLRLIRRIGANARYFTDSATRIPFDVAQGNAAAGMCIDFYGRTYNEVTRRPDGSSRVYYLTPEGGSSVSIDPIAMLRGAPNAEIAQEFIDFVLSPAGQKIWTFRPGTPGGPEHTALRRLPVRRDAYTTENLSYSSDPDVLPFENGGEFEYVSRWTGGHFNPLRFIVRSMCIDTHDELQAAWEALVEAGFPPEATAAFDAIPGISYRDCGRGGAIGKVLGAGDKLAQAKLAQQLAAKFREQYRHARALARENR